VTIPSTRAEQPGHADPRFTLTAYTNALKRRAKLSGAYLAEYERALAWALPWQRLNGQRDRPGWGRDLPRYSRTWLR